MVGHAGLRVLEDHQALPYTGPKIYDVQGLPMSFPELSIRVSRTYH